MDTCTIWPQLIDLRTSAEDLTARREFVGGSDANIILSGDTQKVIDLWLEKRGEKQPPDLTDVLPVNLGCWTESFNRQWFQKLTGRRVSKTGEIVTCGVNGWRRATLDGVVEATGTVFEAKHTNAFAKSEEVLERYMPQLQHNLAVTRYERAVLSVIFGNHKFEMFEIAADWLYQAELLKAEQYFWDCVLVGREPVAAEPPPPPRPIGTREICFEGNNAWASAAFDWLTHRDAAKTHASACTLIKGLIEEDVSRAFGHG